MKKADNDTIKTADDILAQAGELKGQMCNFASRVREAADIVLTPLVRSVTLKILVDGLLEATTSVQTKEAATGAREKANP